MTFPPIPDAVAAVITAVIEDNPFAPPHRQALLAVEALRRQGWRISAPDAGRATTVAVSTGKSQSAPQAA